MAVTVAAAVLLAAVFAGDSVWTALAALLVAGAWGRSLAGRLPLPDGGVVLGGLVLATAAWSGLSIAWSVAPELSWAELNRTLVYAAFLALGLLLGALRQGAKLAAAALVVAFGAGVVWALAGKAIPAVFPDGGRAAGCAIRSGTGTPSRSPPTCCSCSRSRSPPRRADSRGPAGCAALAYAGVVAVLLAASRAGVAAAVLGIVLWLWLRRDRVEAALLVLVATVPAAAWPAGRSPVPRSSRTAPHARTGRRRSLVRIDPARRRRPRRPRRPRGRRRPLAPVARKRVALLLGASRSASRSSRSRGSSSARAGSRTSSAARRSRTTRAGSRA